MKPSNVKLESMQNYVHVADVWLADEVHHPLDLKQQRSIRHEVLLWLSTCYSGSERFVPGLSHNQTSRLFIHQQ